MTARVDTQAAKERAEELLIYGVRQAEDGPYIAVPPTSLAEAVAGDVLALVGLLADAEKALRVAESALDECHRHHGERCLLPGPCACSSLPKVRAVLAAFDAAGGKSE